MHLTSRGVELCRSVSNFFFLSFLFFFEAAVLYICHLKHNLTVNRYLLCHSINIYTMCWAWFEGLVHDTWQKAKQRGCRGAIRSRSVFSDWPCACQRPDPSPRYLACLEPSSRGRDLCIFPTTCGFTGRGDAWTSHCPCHHQCTQGCHSQDLRHKIILLWQTLTCFLCSTPHEEERGAWVTYLMGSWPFSVLIILLGVEVPYSLPGEGMEAQGLPLYCTAIKGTPNHLLWFYLISNK